MGSFLAKKKDFESYDAVLEMAPESTKQNKRYAVRLFGKFVDEQYDGRTISDVVSELLLLKKSHDV